MWISRVVTIGVIVILFSVKPACSQSRSVKNYTTQEGLPSAEVFHILQDRSGFLWFSTSNGIASFDGYEMKAFSVHEGVPDPLVLETREDEAGRIWMRSYSGRIAYHHEGTIYPFVHNDTLSKLCQKGYLEAFAQDSTGQWVFYESHNDLHGTIDKDGTLHMQHLPRNRMAITEYGEHLVIQNSILEVGNDGLLRIDGKELPLKLPPTEAKHSHHHYSAIRWKGKIYFSNKNNLFRYDGKNLKHVWSGDVPIINLSTDSKDRLYVGQMYNGALQFETEDFQHGDTLWFTKNHSVTDVLEDHEGGLWVSTLEAGVFYVPATGIEHYFLPDNPRIKSAVVHDNRILIGTYDGLLLSLDEKTKAIQAEHKFARTVLAIQARHDTVFVATSTNLHVLTDINKPPHYQYKNSVQGVVERKNDILAFTGKSLLAYSFDGSKVLSGVLEDKMIRYAYVEDSRCYLAAHLGLEIRDNNLKSLAKPKELENMKISQLHPVNDTMFVIGTIGSGLLVANKLLTSFSKFESLPRDIYGIVKIGEYFYFASEQGIFAISATDLIDKSFRTVLLNPANGLLDQHISLLRKTTDNKLIVFYDRAFSIIDPRAMRNLNYSPRFYLDRVAVNNKKMHNRKMYQLPYDSNTVQVDFGFVSFNNQDISIRYRLKEDDSWIYPRRTNSINLYSLSPGFYKPELEYSADRFTWQKADILPTFDITYPWWQNPYLQGIAFIGLCTVGFIIVGNRLEVQRERNERLKLLTLQQQQLLDTEKQTTDRERNRIAKDLHDSVGSSLLATKLSIGRILNKYDNDEASEIEQQLSHTLNEIKNIIYDLSPTELERDGLSASVKNYLDKLSGVTDIQLKVIFYGEDITDIRMITPVFRILQELLSNSIKYSSGTSISVYINSFDKLLNIVYEDNGQGFSPALSKGIGRGLTNIEARVGALKGFMKFDSGDYGTTFIFDIPKSQQV